MPLIAQLSDLHITADAEGVVAEESGPVVALRAAISSLLALPAKPDCVVLTGDLTERGLPAEYARLRSELSRLSMPVYPLPGNHDRRENLRAAFPQVPSGSGPVNYVVAVGQVRLVLCDSTIPGSPGGTLSDEAWLDGTLTAEPDRPTIVGLHHPPFPVGVQWIDAMGHSEPERLARIIRAHPQVVRIIAGHVHRGSVTGFGGTVAVSCPSTYRQLHLDLTPSAPPAVTPEPAGFALHLVEEGNAVTHFCPVRTEHSVEYLQ